MTNILFLGTHGQKNWGDELLLSVFMYQLSKKIDHFYVNSYDVKETEQYLAKYSTTVFNTQTDKIKLMLYLLSSKALVFGGGSVIKELNSSYGGEVYSTLNVINTLTKVAKLLRKPIYFSNIGVGPINTQKGIDIAESILQRASWVTVRDSESKKIVDSKMKNVNIKLSSDAVFSVDKTFFDDSYPLTVSDKSLTRIGVNICRNIENNNNWDYFINNLEESLLQYAEVNPNVEFIGIPMQSHVKSNDDYAILDQLRSNMLLKNPNLTFMLYETSSIDQISVLIKSCDILVAERLHALIVSIIFGIPVLALGYDPKVRAIFGDLNLSDYLIDINIEFDQSLIYEKIKSILTNKTEIVDELQKSYEKHHHTSMTDFAELINKVN